MYIVGELCRGKVSNRHIDAPNKMFSGFTVCVCHTIWIISYYKIVVTICDFTLKETISSAFGEFRRLDDFFIQFCATNSDGHIVQIYNIKVVVIALIIFPLTNDVDNLRAGIQQVINVILNHIKVQNRAIIQIFYKSFTQFICCRIICKHSIAVVVCSFQFRIYFVCFVDCTIQAKGMCQTSFPLRYIGNRNIFTFGS